jgi:hypothetical protein
LILLTGLTDTMIDYCRQVLLMTGNDRSAVIVKRRGLPWHPPPLRNSGKAQNHYLIMFSPSGFEEFLKVTVVPAADNAVAPRSAPINQERLWESPAVAARNVH